MGRDIAIDPSIERTVVEWFAKVRMASMVLPSGWFGGRCGENLHELTGIWARDYKLILELDDQLLLVFTGIKSAHIEEFVDRGSEELVLDGFVRLVFDWLAYGSLGPDTEIFDRGEVRFVKIRPVPV